MTQVRDKVAVVTGAGSGIGRALAVELSRRGARVSGCDVDEVGLKETAALCAGDMHQALVDVGDRAAVFAYATEVEDHFGAVHQVYNNAGVAFSRTVLDSEWADYERVLSVNLYGVIHGTQAFLPRLIASGDGHVVNISSLNGYLAQPKMSHYCTSKFAVRGFTETLRTEMAMENLPVRVSVVHPGGIATSIADNSLTHALAAGLPVTAEDEARRDTYNKEMLRMDPQKAAQIIVDGVERNRFRIRVGQDAVMVDRIVRLLPTASGRLATALERRMLKKR
ncbi:MAG: Oxidoreductase, short chain dehydrogenase/reductase family protein [Marmoricola sp.]|jgi:NAD(P)-dependent dehydrogenase (short-subunit alcohol dehydrogenase family)|nr:Oxidoreductase, short chain dehydrogenase/reductase family protein [Marmoricola sp.]MCW2827705.1 Oxidoreductase, short chain dehydrogenase/reductase family protein [Marmoricola sp.]